jgi:hypothetical protein
MRSPLNRGGLTDLRFFDFTRQHAVRAKNNKRLRVRPRSTLREVKATEMFKGCSPLPPLFSCFKQSILFTPSILLLLSFTLAASAAAAVAALSILPGTNLTLAAACCCLNYTFVVIERACNERERAKQANGSAFSNSSCPGRVYQNKQRESGGCKRGSIN